MKSLLIILCAFIIVCDVAGQSFAFGIKGGPSAGMQKWNGFGGRDPLFRYHGIAFIESHSSVSYSSVFAQVGYHIRGSALRIRAYYDPVFGRNIEAHTTNIQFKNIALTAGAKRRHDLGSGKAYYAFGFRGEYTVDTEMTGFFSIYEGLENKIVFGAYFSGGFEIPLGRFVSGVIEASVSPDFSKQIFLPPQRTGFTDAFTGQEIILQEQNISNVSLEISVGLRFLRVITYYD